MAGAFIRRPAGFSSDLDDPPGACCLSSWLGGCRDLAPRVSRAGRRDRGRSTRSVGGHHAVSELAGLIGANQPCVVLTGAGVSTESGIPDFRSTGGIWARFDPYEVAS